MSATETPEPDGLDAHDMARLVAGHGAALDELMARHAEKLFHYLIRSLGDESDAADLAQETFLKVYQNRRRFDPRQRFSTWLYTIATNLVRDRFRWRARHAQVSLDAANLATGGGLHQTLPESGPSPSGSLEAKERAEMVRRAVDTLPSDLRVPLVLAEYEERPQAEIARILGCTVKAVETRIYRARQQLRLHLSKLLTTP
jgi:RNA polymerase sigma-70 factor, ECF subfamily